MPENTVYVGRPSKWGNPFSLENGLEASLDMYRLIYADIYMEQEIKNKLRGKNLACWCPLNQPCHADILLKIANG